MNLTRTLFFPGLAVVGALVASACSGPAKPADEGASLPASQTAVQPGQDPNVRVIELPAPKGAKPGERVYTVISPYPPGSQAAKDAAAAVLKNVAKPKQP